MENQVSASSIYAQSTLAAIVITDGVAFSARMASDEEHTLSLIQRDMSLMRDLCTRFEGQVLKSTGDGLLMYFVSAVQAVTCSLEIQKTLVNHASALSPQNVLVHRIGIHLGDVFFSQTDVMGNGVNIAARLQAEAEPWGICMSQTVYDVVKSRVSLNATYLGPLQLKNIHETVPAYQILPSSAIISAQQPQPSPSTDVQSGKLINNRYRIEKILGRGGFGLTYLVSDTQRFDDLCVLKEFLPTSKTDYIIEKARTLFEREARILYQINHPQIPKFLAWFTEGGRVFIVQEYINGKTYSRLLKERKRSGRLFTETEVVQWLQKILPVLDYLHGINIVHRDISPDNIMLPHGRSHPVLIDFGLVKQTVFQMWAIAPDRDVLTGQASFVGKLGYAPPEQIRMGQCFPCSDLYALGVTAVVFLSGKEPGMLMDQGSLEWRWRSHTQVSDELADILNTLLAEKPNDRYQTAQAVMADLNQFAPVALRRSVSRVSLTNMPSQSGAELTVELKTFVDWCRRELAQQIGPMASCILEDALSHNPHPDAQALVDVLVAEIPNSQKAQAFQAAALQMATQLAILPETSTVEQTRSEVIPAYLTASVKPSSSLKADSDSSTAISSDFLERCRHELARCIGPMAGVVIDDVVTQYPQSSPQELVQAIAAEIPDPHLAQRFQLRLL